MMKTKFLSAMVILVLCVTTVSAKSEKKEKFDVAGNCGMCKTRIEKAANSVSGVSTAVWNKESLKLEVTFDEEKTTIDKVHKAVAKSGHDTKLVKASDKVYDKLPGCCKYERKGKESADCC